MGVDDLSDIITFYSKNGERQRNERNQLEFALTLGVFGALIPPGARVLELGAGAGFFTAHLALAGHSVTAVEITPQLLKQNQSLISELEERSKKNLQVNFIEDDARVLSQLPAGHFDVILNMGPLYHLVEDQDRIASMNAMAQFAHEKTVFLSAVLHRVGYLSYILKNQPQFLTFHESWVEEVMQHGHYLNHPKDGTFRGHFYDLAEVVELHDRAGFELESVLTLDPNLGASDEIFNSLDEEAKARWVRYLLQKISDPQFLHTGRTWLAVSHLKSGSGSKA